MGVEEEFLLVDAHTRQAVPRAGAVLADAAGDGDGLGTELHAELLSSQVEAVTGRCTELAELEQHLRCGRRTLATAARRSEALLVSTGTPVVSGPPPPVSDGERFHRIAEAYRHVVADYQSCGCHVHVGVPDQDTGVAVLNHLRPWLPVLVALSANSPYHLGRDTGYMSWRIVLQSRFPGSGVPPYFTSAAAYHEQLDRLVACGALVDPRMNFWLARLSPHLPTVEVRATDALLAVEDTVLVAALTRGLVRHALAELAAGREAPRVGEQAAAAAVWSAARYGPTGQAVDLLREERVPAPELVRTMLDRVSPALEETGDLAVVRERLRSLSAHGTGADQQRRAARGGPLAVVDMIADHTYPLRPVRAMTPEEAR